MRAISLCDDLAAINPGLHRLKVVCATSPMKLPDPRRWIPVIAILAGIHTLAFLAISFSSIGAGRDIQYPESAIVYGVTRVRDHQPLYQDYQHEPFAIVAYTPLYYELAGAAARLVRGIRGTYLVSRGITLGSSLILSLLVFFSASRVASKLSSAIASALFLGSGVLIPWGYAARVDMLALLLAASSLFLLARSECRTVVLPALLLAAAFLTKQSSVALVPVAFICIARASTRRSLIRFGATWVYVVLLGMILGAFAFGPAFTLNVFGSAVVPASFRSVIDVAWRAIPSLAAPVLLGAGAIAAFPAAWRNFKLGGNSEKTKSIVPVLFSAYFVTALIVAVMTSAKAGSDVNYYIEPLLAACVCAAQALDHVRRGERVKKVILAAAAVALIGDAGLKINKAVHSELLTPPNDEVVELVRETPGEVLAQDANVLLQAGKRITLTDPYHLAVLEENGRWDSAALREEISSGKFALIILSFEIGAPKRPSWTSYQGFEILSDSVQKAIAGSYVHEKEVQGWHLYRPRR